MPQKEIQKEIAEIKKYMKQNKIRIVNTLCDGLNDVEKYYNSALLQLQSML
jgi:hypothetical protein